MRASSNHLKIPAFVPPQIEVSMYQELPKEFVPSLGSKTVVCDIDGTLLKFNHSFFPYFMLVAFEAHGGFLRAFLLLIAYPLLWLLPSEIKLRLMVFITFCGLSLKDMDWIQRAVLPKFYHENLNYQGYELFASARKKAIFTAMPKIMVEGFAKDYLGADHVSGTELYRLGPYFTGLLSGSGLLLKHKALKAHFGEKKPSDVVAIVATTSSYNYRNHDDLLFLSYFKEDLLVIKQNYQHFPHSKVPKIKHLKPVIFHDGRLAFLPTPKATLCMFMWLPMGIILSIIRPLVSLLLPFKLSFVICSFIGMRLRLNNNNNNNNNLISHNDSTYKRNNVLYVSNHRTLLDPLFISACMGKSITAVTYSLSRLSETLSIVRTERLTRDRKRDEEKIRHLLTEDDVVILPEGTTCREPYLLRFSRLFAEITDEIVPVAIDTRVSMFYGNTANGFKATDPFYFVMNPEPTYVMSIMEKLPKEFTCGGGGKSSVEVANYMQRRIGEVLGFECTSLTRKDKYMLLAGHQGLVNHSK